MQNNYYKCGLALQVLSVGHGKGQFLLDRRLMDHHPFRRTAILCSTAQAPITLQAL